MKNSLVAVICGIIVAITLLFLLRFDVDVHSPIVCRLDRWTGKVWIVNQGTWRLVKPETETATAAPLTSGIQK